MMRAVSEPAPSLDSGWLRLGLLAAAAVVFVRTAWLCDDAYITLRTVSNFVAGFGPRFNVAERVQAFTHPLWFLLETPFFALSQESFYTPLALSLVVSLLAVGALLTWPGASLGATALAIWLLLLSRSFVDFSSSGLENPLTHLLLAVLLRALMRAPSDLRSLRVASLTAGLGALNRIDMILLLAPALLLLAWRRREAKAWATIALGFVPLALWEIFATFYYGFPVPNTAFAKLGAGVDAVSLYGHGLTYLANSLREDPVTLPVIGLAITRSVAAGGERERAVALGVLLYLLYVVRIGGDFMSGRFLSAPYFASVVLLVLMRPLLARPFPRVALAAVAAVLAALAPHPSLVSGRDFGSDTTALLDPHGTGDARRFVFSTLGLLNERPAWPKPSPPIDAMGRTAQREQIPVLPEIAIGITGFFAGAGVHVVDLMALADPLLARLPAVRSDPDYAAFRKQLGLPPTSDDWMTGHLRRNLPRGYLRTLVSGANWIEDPEIHALWDRLSRVTRGPLWDRGRLREIVRLNLENGGRLVGRERPVVERADLDEILDLRPDVPELLFRRGSMRMALGQTTAAKRDFARVIELDPQHARARAALARINDLPPADAPAGDRRAQSHRNERQTFSK